MFLSIEKQLKKKRFKKKGGILYEWIIYGLCLLALYSFYTYVGPFFMNLIKRGGAGDEAKQISQQVVAYSALRRDGKLPPTLEVLLDDTAIAASDSTDGTAYGKFLSKTGRWVDGKIIDPWGVEYEYIQNADGTGSISSVGGDKEITVHF